MPTSRPSARSLGATCSRRDALKLGAAASVALLVAACGGADNSEETAPQALDLDKAVTAFTIVAKNLEWDLERVVVPAGEEITATIDNQDRGVPHNLHVKSLGDPKTELEDGIVTQTLRFTITEPGSYEFVCDAHPKMTGTIEAV